MKPTRLLRRILDEPGLILKPNCFDPLSARIAESLGFKAVGLGGWALGAHTCLTEPLTTLTETVSAASYIVRAINIPLIVDADAGFGEPMHVTRTVEEFERAGVGGIHIEDQIYPKRAHYHKDYQERVIPMEDMIEKIKYACEARDDPDFVLIARTDAAHTHGIDEAIRRANTYVKAGADVIMAFPDTLEATKIFPKQVKAPTIYVNSVGNRVGRVILTAQEAEEIGYKIMSDSTSVILASFSAIKGVFQHYRDEGEPELSGPLAKSLRKEVEDIIGLPRYYKIEEETTEKKD